jgi:hypothetical protein
VRAWQEGDSVGTGRVYLPDANARLAYATACRRAILDSAARHAVNLPTLELRRDFINSFPAHMQDALKEKVADLWKAK